MKKQSYLLKFEEISRNIVKFAFTLPDSKIGTRAKQELVDSATKAFSYYQVACIDESSNESVDNFNNALEKGGLLKFWLEFLREEGITQPPEVNHLVESLSSLISNTVFLRNYELTLINQNKTYAGEWLLDD